MAVRHLLFNRLTGYTAVFAAIYAIAVRSGLAEWLDPLFGLGVGLIFYRYVSQWLAMVPWAYASIQLAIIFGLPTAGAVTAILLMCCGYLLLLNPSRFAGKLRIGDLRLQPSEISDICIEQGIGDVHIDFSAAFMPPGGFQVAIHRLVGNVVIYVPNGLEVEADLQVMVGGPEAFGRKPLRFRRHLRTETDRYETASSRLRLMVTTVIGDVSVRYL
ncbi:cell wall-active antibiotics response protein LiaF [Paenibacillus sp. P26]|nr:cell wall-active antibiotics response protein LiaF [Paenibacillus sp. P26]UUZ94873.1 cell wall-active antibiotics response protein LiaF [Paenibacillus sp. P25]